MDQILVDINIIMNRKNNIMALINEIGKDEEAEAEKYISPTKLDLSITVKEKGTRTGSQYE